MDEWERDLAFYQVAAGRLSERCIVRREIQQIVCKLKCHSKVHPKIPERGLHLRVGTGQDRTYLTASGKEVCRLSLQNIVILILGDFRVADQRKLYQLSFRHFSGEIGKYVQYLEGTFFQRDLESGHIQPIAHQNGSL